MTVCSTSVEESKEDPSVNPWHSASLNLDISQVCLGFKQSFVSEDWHLQIQRRITKELVYQRKKKLSKATHHLQDMCPAKMLPGNRTFLWERTQITHLSGMPMLGNSPGIPLQDLKCVMFSDVHPYERSRVPTSPMVTSLHRKAYKRELPT